ncbi:MAG: ABC transporter substrate-binding protein [Planctomycetes bacterium]|nr:ABC transporter substrate-binding protein [Planctomycetota bacterium]MBI3846751.1 ABC transporter substrate-binding protein [Planctomycetota bacterium]
MSTIVRDALGRNLALDRPPRRIVSLVPSLTETCIALGVRERLVGATEFCVFPEEAKTIPRVGGTISVSVEKVRALVPDVVLASADENRKPQIESLEGAGIPVFVTWPRTLPEIFETIEATARIVGEEVTGLSLARGLRRRAVEIEESLILARPVRVAYLIWRDPWMATGLETYVHDLLRRAGGRNAAAGAHDPSVQGSPRYPGFTDDGLRALAPDVVLLPSEPFVFGERDAADVRSLLPHARVLLVDGEPINWAGPRSVDGLEILARALHGR